MTELKNKTLVVVGVSHKEEKFGYKIFKDLLDAGYKVDGINPSNGIILGKKIFHNLKELPYVPDIVITIVPPAVTEKIIDDCIELKIREVWMQPGSESQKAIEKAQKSSINVVANACFMLQKKIW